MKLHRLAVRDYKGIEERDVRVPESGILVLEGPNEIGKSSMLEALDLLLEHKDSSKRAQIRAARPVDRDVGPWVEVEMSTGPYRFTYRKRWLRQPRTELEITAPRRAHLVGDEAHERVRAMLAETADMSLWRALRLLQATPLLQGDFAGSSALAAALDAAAGSAGGAYGAVDGASADDPGAVGASAAGAGRGAGETAGVGDSGLAETLLAATEAVYLRYFTARTGVPTGEYRTALDRHEQAQEALSLAQAALDEVAHDVAAHDRLHAELVGAQEQLTRAREERDGFAQRWAQIREVVERIEQARERRDEMARALERERERRDQRSASVAAVASRQDSLEAAQREVDALREALEPAAQELGEAVQAHDAALAAERSARDRLDRATRSVAQERDRAELEALNARLTRIDACAATVARSRAALEIHPVTTRLLRAIEAAQQALDLAVATQRAGSAAVVVRALGDSSGHGSSGAPGAVQGDLQGDLLGDVRGDDVQGGDPSGMRGDAPADVAGEGPSGAQDDGPTAAPDGQGGSGGGQVVHVDGEEVLVAPATPWEAAISHTMRLVLPGDLEVELRPEAGAAQRAEAVREAREGVAELLRDAGVTDLGAARRAHELRQEHEGTLRRSQEQLEALLDGADRATLQEAHERLRATLGDRPEPDAAADSEGSTHGGPGESDAATDLEGSARGGPAESDAPAQVEGSPRGGSVASDAPADAAAELAAAREVEGASRDEVVRCAARRQALHDQAQTLQVELARADSLLGAMRAQTAELEESVRAAREVCPDAELEEAVDRAVEALTSAQGRLDLEEELLAGQDAQGLELLHHSATAEVEGLQARVRTVQEERIRVEARLEHAGSQGRAEEFDAACSEEQHAASRLATVRRHAEAARLLRTTLTEKSQAAKQAYVRPFSDAVCRLGRIVYGPSFEVEVDDALTIQARVVNGRRIPYDALSTGAKEQLAIITRLACASLIDADQGVPVVIDDALGYSDPEKLRRVCATFGRLGGDAQVILLTCTPGRYASIGDAEVVRL